MFGKNRSRVVDNGDGKMGEGVSFTKMFYQMLQLLHHIGVTKQQAEGKLSKSFERKTAYLNKFVRPARPNENIRREIHNTNLAWATNMGRVMLKHYQTSLTKLTENISAANLSNETIQSAKQTALQWAKRNFGNKLQSKTVTEFVNQIRDACSGHQTSDRGQENCRSSTNHPSTSKTSKHADTRGKNGSHYPAPWYTKNLPGSTPIPGASKPIFRQNRSPPGSWNSEQYISNIVNSLDPASNDYACEVCLPNSFENATFASGTHALAYAQAIYLDQDSLATAIFAAKTAGEVIQLTRQLPADSGNWLQHAQDVLWEIFIWKFRHIPAFTNRVFEARQTNFLNRSWDPYWGMGPMGMGDNLYGKALSQFCSFQLDYTTPPPPMPLITPTAKSPTALHNGNPTPQTSQTYGPTPPPLEASPVLPQGWNYSITTPVATPVIPINCFPELSVPPSPLPTTPKPLKTNTVPDPRSTSPRTDNNDKPVTVVKPLYATVVST
ncbi:MAG: NADAR domain-containing protein, partial [Chromatiales bacterium]